IRPQHSRRHQHGQHHKRPPPAAGGPRARAAQRLVELGGHLLGRAQLGHDLLVALPGFAPALEVPGQLRHDAHARLAVGVQPPLDGVHIPLHRRQYVQRRAADLPLHPSSLPSTCSTQAANCRQISVCCASAARPASVTVYTRRGTLPTPARPSGLSQAEVMQPSSSSRYKMGYSVPSFRSSCPPLAARSRTISAYPWAGCAASRRSTSISNTPFFSWRAKRSSPGMARPPLLIFCFTKYYISQIKSGVKR